MKDPNFGLGSYDNASIHNLNPSESKTNYGSNRDHSKGIRFPSDFSPLGPGYGSGGGTYVTDYDVLQPVIDKTIDELSEEEKNKLLQDYYKDKFQSEETKQRLEERRQEMESRRKLHDWGKYLLLVFTFLFILSLVAVVATIIYTSISSGMMTETGLFSAIVTFASEIIRLLLGN